MTQHNQIVGAYGERTAARHLVRQGMTLLDRNWRCPAGELDLVARDGDELVFVEVKTRRGVRFGWPVEAVVPAKTRRVRRAAASWLAARRRSPRHPRDIRFDVVSVLLGPAGPAVEHLRGAF